MSVASIIAHIENICESEMNRIANQIEGELKAEANKDTGRMAGSIQSQRTGDYSYFIGTSLEYARYANDGRGEVLPGAITGRGMRRTMLKYKDGSLHRYSSPYAGSHFVEKVASRYR